MSNLYILFCFLVCYTIICLSKKKSYTIIYFHIYIYIYLAWFNFVFLNVSSLVNDLIIYIYVYMFTSTIYAWVHVILCIYILYSFSHYNFWGMYFVFIMSCTIWLFFLSSKLIRSLFFLGFKKLLTILNSCLLCQISKEIL